MTPFDLQALLRDDRWMRRVARGLLRDPHDAEDAVQDAWLAELEAGGGRLARRRGWLRGVLWNRASGTVRRERVLRERALDGGRERAESLAPSAAEDAAAREAKRAVVEAVLDLDEDLRAAVHLTYLADLSTREVAARTGVSPTAVRKRLARAHDELRRRLDAEHGGDRRAWTLALTPFLRPEPAPLAAAAARHTEPRLAMRPIELLAAAAVAVTAVASFSVLVGAPNPVGPAPARVAPAAGPVTSATAGAPAAPARTSPPQATAQVTEVAPEAIIHGRFLLPDGTPAQGCEWHLVGSAANEQRTEQFGLPGDWSDLSGTTDAEGRVEIEFVPPPAYSFRLRVERADFAGERWWFYDCRRGSTTDLGTYELRPESRLTVRLVDAQGQPVTAGAASVQVVGASERSFSVRSSLRRHVRIEHGSSSATAGGLGADRYEVRVHGPTAGQSAETFVSLVAGEQRSVDVVIEPPAGSQGPPAPSAAAPVRLSFRNRHPFQHGTPEIEWVEATDSNGDRVELRQERSRFGPLSTVGGFTPPLTVSVEDPRFEPWTVDDLAPGDEVNAALEGGAALHLDVRAPDGTQIHDYSVRVGGTMTTGAPLWELATGPGTPPDGLIEGLVAEVPLRIRVTTPTLAAQVDVDGPIAGAITELTVPLQPRFTVSGRVLSPGGAPSGFVDVFLVRPAEFGDSNESKLIVGAPNRVPPNARVTVASAQSDASGRYTLEVPETGAYRILASSGAGVQAWSDEIELAEAASAPDVVLPRGAVLRVRVELPDGLDPRQLVVRTDLGKGGVVRTVGHPTPDSRGWFELRELPAGGVDIYLQVDRRSFGKIFGLPPVCSVELDEGEVRSLDLTGAPGAPGVPGVPGLVRLSTSGSPVGPEGATFWIGRPDEGGWSSMTFGHRTDEAMTVAPPLPLEPGAWTVHAFGSDWSASTQTVVDLGSGDVLDLDIDLDLVQSDFIVTVAGAPLADAEVRLRRTDVPKPAEAPFETDGDGALSISLEPGEYLVRAYVEDDPGGSPAWQEAEVTWPLANGAVIELD